MKKLTEILKKIFANEPEKQKVIDEFEKQLEDNLEVQFPENKKEEKIDNQFDSIQHLKELIIRYTEENKRLLSALAELQEKERQREEYIRKQAEKDLQEKIEKIINEAIADGRIPPRNDELISLYKNMLQRDFDATKKILDSLPKESKENKKEIQHNSLLENQPKNRAHLFELAKQEFKTN